MKIKIKRKTKKIILYALICILICATALLGERYYDLTLKYSKLETALHDDTDKKDDVDSEATDTTDADFCVFFGDSVLGRKEPPNDYPTTVAQVTGMKVFNAGFGGTRASYHPYAEYDAFCMYRLADAITSGDWSLQDDAIQHVNSDLFPKRYEELKKIDWNEVDIITIAFGTNDINGRASLDNPDDPLDPKTILGAFRYSVERITTTYPDIHIMLITPLYRVWLDKDIDSDSREFEDYTYIDMVDGIISVANQYKIPCLDLYRTSGFNKLNYTHYYATDAVHPDDAGLRIMGEKIGSALMFYF